MITVKFHRGLRKFTKGARSVTLDADTYLDVMRICMSLFPQFEKAVKKIGRKFYLEEMAIVEEGNRIVLPEEMILAVPKNKFITICPIFGGSGDNALTYIYVIIIIVVIIFFWWNPYGWAYGTTVASAGGTAVVPTTTITLTTVGTLAVGLAINAFIALVSMALLDSPKSSQAEGSRNEFFGALK